MFITNLDRTDAQLNTKAPFKFECDLRLEDITLPSCSILSVKLYMDDGMKLPCRLSRLTAGASGYYTDVEFVDGGGLQIGTWRVHNTTSKESDYVSGFVYDGTGVISGHITCSSMLPSLLSSICRAHGGTVETDVNDFILLPQCCLPFYKGKGKAIVVNDYATTDNTTITTSSKMGCKLDSNGNVRIDAYGDLLCDTLITDEHTVRVGKNLVTKLFVGNAEFDVGGKHLIIKAGVTSNLRVTEKAKEGKTATDQTEASSGVIFSGVADE